jgi:hypothetical protein
MTFTFASAVVFVALSLVAGYAWWRAMFTFRSSGSDLFRAMARVFRRQTIHPTA